MLRIIVLTSSPFGTASLCLPELVRSKEIKIVSVILAEGSVSASRRAHYRRKLKKTLKIGLFGALNGLRMRRWFHPIATEHIHDLCERWSIPLHRTGSINSDRTVALFSAADADLGLSLGNSFISRRVFSVPRYGMVNFHGERLPEYQNGQSIIWPIYNMERTTGLTIHQIDDGIDTGSVLHKEEFPIVFRPSLRETVKCSRQVTSGKVAAAVRFVCENYIALASAAVKQTKGRSYTTPSARQFYIMSRNNRRLFARSNGN